jgi:GT2 family glycosyltransferase
MAGDPSAIQRIAVIYDTTVRPDTTGEYCRCALQQLGLTVSHYLPTEVEDLPPIYDLYLWVDDDFAYQIPDRLRPLAYWAIDTHRDYPSRLARGRTADFVFCAQRDGAMRMRADGICRAAWLPLACDPAVHRRIPDECKVHDIAFVGNLFPGDGRRSELVAWLQQRYPTAFVGQAYGLEMARVYSRAKLVFNCAIRNDINMRVFEAVSCGSLLVTNDLADNGQDLLFLPGRHLVTYRDPEELAQVIERYLADEPVREAIAAEGMRHAHAHHTYRHRMADLLAAVSEASRLDERYPVAADAANEAIHGHGADEEGGGHGARWVGCDRAPARSLALPTLVMPDPAQRRPAAGLPPAGAGRPRASIIIPAFNRLEMTKRCVAHLRAHTDLPYEIVLVDNGSSDGTADWGRGEGLHVIANRENRGFPEACNQGLLASEGAYLVLLNNDVLVSPGWLGRLAAHAERDGGVGLVGPSTNFAFSYQQVPVPYCEEQGFLAFAAELAVRYAGHAQPVTRLVGLCLLIPRAVREAVGLLDPRFGLGLFEDDDYCLRVRMAGYLVLWARDVFVHHEGHQTFRDLPEWEYRRRLDRNRERLLDKWRGSHSLIAWQEELDRTARLQSGQADGWDLLHAGRYDEAYEVFEERLRMVGTDSRLLLGLGLAAEGRGVPRAAALAYRAILAGEPEHAEAARALARLGGGPAGKPREAAGEQSAHTLAMGARR